MSSAARPFRRSKIRLPIGNEIVRARQSCPDLRCSLKTVRLARGLRSWAKPGVQLL